MEGKSGVFILFCVATAALASPTQNTQIETESKPGQEFVFVQSSGSEARPISRKEDKEHQFETAHKIPPGLTFALNNEEDDEVPLEKVKPAKISGKKVHKRQAAESPAPAPPGAIKLTVAQLLEKYKHVMQITSTQAPSSSTTTSKSTKAGRRRGAKKRTSRAAEPINNSGPTSPRPVLTTAKIAPKSIDIDVVGSASEKQRSRIQIKKGPNGQEYEYEYVYYYYDDDDDKDKVTNSHDGPAKNSISRSDKTRQKPTPEANEVVPSRGKSRARQLGEEDPVQEERLPANTRSRNLNTTPLPEDESKPTAARGRGRGRPSADASTVAPEDNVSDETQGSRGRTRANVRRPSLELVDSETFNTHAAAAQSPSFPAQLPAGPEEPADKPEASKEPVGERNGEETSKSTLEETEATTLVTGMNKVALDLYAISQGTQKLFGEESSDLSTEEDRADGTTLDSSSTEEVETTTATTTTTTTTTTTPAPTTRTTTTTTTTTTEAPTKGISRFGGRRTPLSGRKLSSTTTTTEASASSEPKPNKKFGRPSFGGRSRPKPTTAAPASEEVVNKEESKPVSQSNKPTRSRFGASRPRGRTTAAPEDTNKEESSTSASTAASHRPSLPRARPSFNTLRGRGRSTTTTAPPSEENVSDSEASSSEASSTTTSRPARRIAGVNNNIKSLRPGPRINLVGRRGAQTTTTSTEASNAEEDHHVTGDEEETHAEAASEKEEAPAPAPVDNSPLGRLRNKNRLHVQPKAKTSASAASASAPVQVRRVNPLLNRRRPGQTTETPSSEAPSSEATEPEVEEPAAAETEAAPSSSSTTEEPRGLSKLLAGRRRLATRTPGTINHK